MDDQPATLPIAPSTRPAAQPAGGRGRLAAPTLARLGWRILGGGVAVFALLVASWLWSSWQNTCRSQDDRNQLTATLLAQNADGVFLRVQDDLQQLGGTLVHGNMLRSPGQALHALQTFKDRHRRLGGVSVVLPDGQMFASTLVEDSRALPNLVLEPAYASYREDFAQALHAHGLSVGRPQYGRLSRKWFIPLRYAVRGVDGVPQFVVQTSFFLDDQQALWRGLSLQAGTAIGLLRNDGWLVSRYPDVAGNGAAYERRTGGALQQALARERGARSGLYAGLALDGQLRRGAWAQLRDYPLVAFLSYPRASIVSLWWQEVRMPLLILGALLVLLSGLYASLMRHFMQRMVRIRKQMEFARPEDLHSSGVAEIDALLRQLVRSREHMRRLARNREKMLLEAAQAGTYTRAVDNGVLLAVDATFERMLRRPARRLVGREWNELFHDAGFLPGTRVESASDNSGRRLVWTRGKGAEIIWLSLAEHTEVASSGEKVLHGMAIDVSERENLLRVVARQSQRLQTLWELVAGQGENPQPGAVDAISGVLAHGRDDLGLQAAVICARLDGQCRVVHAQDLHGRFREGQVLADDHPLCACGADEYLPLWVADATRDPALAQVPGIGCLIRLPLRHGQHSLGYLLLLGDSAQTGGFDPADHHYAELLAAWFARTLFDDGQRDTLRNEAYTDGLTGLPNRRAAQLRLDEALQAMRRGEPSFCVALCDLDRFKAVNDEWGHVAGDSLLREVASHLQQTVPQGAWVARWGGEEFLVMLPGFSMDDARAAMDQLRGRLSQRPFLIGERRVYVTVSVGIGAPQGAQDEIVRVLTEADDGLYEAKHQGRNRVVSLR